MNMLYGKLKAWVHLGFLATFTKGHNFCDLFASLDSETFEKGCDYEGKNLFLHEQILFFKTCSLLRSDAKRKITEFLSLQKYPYHQICLLDLKSSNSRHIQSAKKQASFPS